MGHSSVDSLEGAVMTKTFQMFFNVPPAKYTDLGISGAIDHSIRATSELGACSPSYMYQDIIWCSGISVDQSKQNRWPEVDGGRKGGGGNR